MIDKTQLTEALARWPRRDVIAEAARLLLDFPTDEQVEAAAKAFNGTYRDNETREFVQAPWQHDIEDMRAVLVAVRDTMIGDNQ